MKRFIKFLWFFNCSLAMNMYTDVLKFHLSDQWYPSKSKVLRQQMNELQLSAQNRYKSNLDSKKIKAIIVPHAGYSYSGILACGVYQNLKPKIFDHIIILAPSHHLHFHGVALPGSEYTAYKSPLRQTEINQHFLQKLKKRSSLFDIKHHVHELEHAIEIQIPFIQKYCGFCKIIPLIVGDLNYSQIQEVADVLHACMKSKTLIIVSSDLTHYGTMFDYMPFDHNVLNNIWHIDEQLIDAILQQDPGIFLKTIQDFKDPVCGKNSVLILLSMLQKKYLENVRCLRIGYTTSSQDPNTSNCVSYVGMIVTSEL